VAAVLCCGTEAAAALLRGLGEVVTDEIVNEAVAIVIDAVVGDLAAVAGEEPACLVVGWAAVGLLHL